MSFHCLVYNGSAVGVNASNTDLTAATDTEFTARNGHYVFTEDYDLWAAALVGASVTRGRFQSPKWNAWGEFQLFNANRSLQPPTNAQYDMYRDQPPRIPQKEEFQAQVSGNLGSGTEIDNCVILIAAPSTTRNLPVGSGDLGPNAMYIVRASFTVTPTLNAWSGPQVLTFSQNLRGGVYAVVGAVCQGSNAVAFRLVFPRYKLIQNRRLRPGWLTQNAIGDFIQTQLDPWILGMGEWGRFNFYEPVQCEVFGTAANSTTYQLFLWVKYLGFDDGLLQQSASYAA